MFYYFSSSSTGIINPAASFSETDIIMSEVIVMFLYVFFTYEANSSFENSASLPFLEYLPFFSTYSSCNSSKVGTEKETFILNNCAETEMIQGSRGGCAKSDIHIHSVRMPGYMASQEVLFGSMGQTLSIRHDSHDRKCYMPGVIMATKYIAKNENSFIYGLENIM